MKYNELLLHHKTLIFKHLIMLFGLKYMRINCYEMPDSMTVNHWVAGSSPAGGAKYQKAVSNDGFFFGPMISSLSVNHWRKQCFRLVRAQQAEPNNTKSCSDAAFYVCKQTLCVASETLFCGLKKTF